MREGKLQPRTTQMREPRGVEASFETLASRVRGSGISQLCRSKLTFSNDLRAEPLTSARAERPVLHSV